MPNWTLFQLEKVIGEIKSENHTPYHAKLPEKEDPSELDLSQDLEVPELLDNQQPKKSYNSQESRIVIPVQEDHVKLKEIVLKLYTVLYKELITSWPLISGVPPKLKLYNMNNSKVSLD